VIEVASPDGIAMPVDALVAAIDERVAIVAVSLVAYSNGALLRARQVIDAAHAAGAIVILDAYQAVGIVPVDVRALGADAVIAGTHKWLHGASNGLAFAYVRRALAERLTPAYPGWFSHARMLDFDPVYTPAPGARRFEQGSTSVEAVYAARAGVEFALDAGVEAIRERSFSLSDRLIAGADALGIPLTTPRDRAERAGVVCLGVRDPGRVAEQLRARGIDVDTRPGTGIRLSLHPCNLPEEVDQVLAELRRFV
jgi:kynureninase